MGTRGPMPKRAEDLKGHVSRDRRDNTDVTAISIQQGQALKAKQPPASKDWEPPARLIWKALRTSTFTATYEATDWAIAYSTMHVLSAYYANERRNGELLTTIAANFDELLLTEGARRRLRIETEPRETPVKPPTASKGWHPNAKRIWKAARDTPAITRYYEPTDWAVLHFVTGELSRLFETDYPSGKLKATLDSVMSNLMLTEGTRRRLDLELGTAQTQQLGKTAGELEADRLFAEMSSYLQGVNDASVGTDTSEA